MFGRFAKQDNRFQASEWSPGYFVSTTSRAKGLPPARHDPSTNKRGKETVQYNHMLMTARSRPPGHDPYARMKPKPPQLDFRYPPQGNDLGMFQRKLLQVALRAKKGTVDL